MSGEPSTRICDVVGCGDPSVLRYLDCEGPAARAFWVCSSHAARLEAGASPVVVPLEPGSPASVRGGAALLLD